MRRATPIVAALPPLALTGFGLTHPNPLTVDSASWWTTMHIIVAPIFALLAASHWLVLRGDNGPAAWIARVASWSYLVFYGALDAIAGIGTGSLVQDGESPDGPAVRALFDIGNALGRFGVYSYLVTCLATAAALYLRHGKRALPAGVTLIVGAAPFIDGHIYWPVGVAGMLLTALGFALLLLVPPATDPR
jgi:hypothetical protein